MRSSWAFATRGRRSNYASPRRSKLSCSPCSIKLRPSRSARLHCLLLVSESDSHLCQGRLVERARYLQAFCLLVFPQAGPSVCVEFPGLLAIIKTSLLENRLRLLSLIGSGAKDRTSISIIGRVSVFRAILACVRVC